MILIILSGIWAFAGGIACAVSFSTLDANTWAEFYLEIGVKSAAQALFLTLAFGPIVWLVLIVRLIVIMIASNVKSLWGWLERFGKYDI